jgi:hypothetical protein
VAHVASVSECIQELRQELTYALASGQGEALRFALGSVEMELSVEIAREAASGGIRFWVASSGEKTPPSLHKITLNLTPQLMSDQSIVKIDDHDEPPDLPRRQVENPVVITRDQVPEELVARYTPKPQDYR